MRYTFFNKNMKLFDFNYNENSKTIDQIIEVINPEYFPLKLSGYIDNNDLLDKFYSWLNSRYSKNSSWYKKVQWKYGESNVDREFIIKSYGLSLSDQYWLKPSFAKETWEDINFFQNSFQYQPFLANDLERVYDYKDVDVLYSPNITTGGELDKAWAIEEDGTRVLYKSSNTFLGLEPINEYMASRVCAILDLSHADSKIKILSNSDNKIMVSSCPTFITPDTELIHADDLIDSNLSPYSAFMDYINTLSNLGIRNAKEKVQKMIFLDCILSNQDRHKQNFGVIRDVNTLEYIDIAPIYDTGRSMSTNYPSIDQYKDDFCLFNVSNATRQDCLKLLDGLTLTTKQIDALLEMPNLYSDKLREYIEYTNIRPELVEQDIDKLRNFFKNNLIESLEYVKEYNVEEEIGSNNGDIDI